MPCVALSQTRAHKRRRKAQKSPNSQPTAARQTQTAQPTAVPQPSAKAPSSSQQSAAVRLKDGDRVQIHPHRPRPSAKPAPVPKPTRPARSKPTKPTRLKLKKRLKSKRRPSRAELINAESRLGSTIFGPIPEGHRREFFHDRENIWIWHESWVDADKHIRQLTVRYEVRPTGVYKKLSAGKYFKLEGAELENFRKATRAYLRIIKQQLYHVA